MAVTVNCPSCGGGVEVASKASRVAACPFCNSTLIVNADAIRALGKMALLAETPSCLAVGWPAQCLGRDIRVLGRLQYQYDAGLWDEWWVQFVDDGSYAWISQDEGEYTLEVALEGITAPTFEEVDPGDTFKLNGRRLRLMEKNSAVMAGMQGEIPLEAGPGKPMRYLDLAGKGVRATIEYFDDGSFQAYEGQALKPRDLQSDLPSGLGGELPDLPHPPPTESGPAPIIKAAAGLRPQTVSCPSCGGTVKLRDAAGSAMVVCEHCHGALDVSVEGKTELLYQAEKNHRSFPLPIGATGKLRGAEYTATGFVAYRQVEDGEIYDWTAMQLFNPEQGYAFLEVENGHWMLFKPLANPPGRDPRQLRARKTFSYLGQSYKVFERGTGKIHYVEGELSWVARVGDPVHYMDAIRPPYMLSAEWSAKELEWSLGEYVTPQEVAQAFKRPEIAKLKPRGVAPAQPFGETKGQRRRTWIGLAGAAALAALLLNAYLTTGRYVASYSGITSQEYMSERGYLSEPFEIPAGTHTCKVTVTGNGLSNSWVSVSLAFLDEQEQILLDADATVERYSGTEGGERWSEGSGNDYTLVRLEGPKTYRLVVFGEAGVWSPSGGDRLASSGGSVNVQIERDVVPARFFLGGVLIAGAYPVLHLLRKFIFESSRWPSDD